LVELTNDQFDEVEIREVSCFGAVPMKSESRLNTFLRSATANGFSWSFRSICYCGSAMGVTHSCECASESWDLATQDVSQTLGVASQHNRPLDFCFGSQAQ